MSESSEKVGDDIGLLDLMVIVAERWLIVVIVPLVVGIAAYFFVASQPQPWRAHVVVGMPDTFVTAGLANLDSDGIAGTHASAAEIKAGLSILPMSLSGRSMIELTLSDRAAVSTTLNAMIETLRRKTDSGEIPWSAGILSGQIAATSAEIGIRTQVIESLEQQLAALRANPNEDGTVLAQTAATLNDVMASREIQTGQLDYLKDKLAFAPKEVVEVSPTDPVQVGLSSPARSAIIAAIGALFIVMVIVLVQIGFTVMASDPRARPKINRIRRAFWLNPIGTDK